MTLVKGMNAVELLNSTGTKNALKYLKAGQSMTVSVPSTEEIAQVFTHGVYQVFNTSLCTRDDYYDKAVDVIYSQANAETDENKKKDLKDKAYQLKAKPTFLFGFHDLETGEPILISTSKKQGKGLYAVIQEYKEELQDYAFKLSKAEGGTISLTPILKGLTATEKENFEATKGKELSADLYNNAFYKRDKAGQLEDLKKFGFDISLIVEVPQAQPTIEEYPEF